MKYKVSVLDLFSLAGKIVVVTGGAGRHAPALVKALVEAGAATVYAADLDAARVRQAIELFAGENQSFSARVAALNLDLKNEKSILAARDSILNRDGRIDVLVNAAVSRPVADWADGAGLFRESMEVNATGLFLATKTFGDVMAARGAGSIINIASIQGMVGPDPTLYEGLDFHGLIPDYFFHKGGMINFTRFVAAYYGGRGVRCNCLSPGGLQTEDTPAEFVRRYSARTFLGRMAQAQDVAAAVVFLASAASDYLTGVNIPVDGGYTAK